MKKLIFGIIVFGLSSGVFAQKYMTQSGNIKFFSSTPLEDIEATNSQVSSVINLENGEMAFSLLMKAFTFEKALMQEHFNEKYVESDKYPKASFKGKIVGFKSSVLSSDFKEFSIKGTLTIHGVSKEIEAIGKLKKKGDSIVGESVFSIVLADYDIKIPAAVKDNIDEEIEITITMEYEKLD